MRFMTLVLVLFCLAGVFACDTDGTPSESAGPSDPAPKLVGSWRFASTSFTGKLLANARKYLAAKDVDQFAADEIIELLRSDVAGIVNKGVFTFNADNTFSFDDTDDYLDDRGTWHVSGDSLTVLGQDESVTVRFRATDARLTWILLRPDITRMRAELEALDPEMGLILFLGISTYSFYFTRVQTGT